MPRKSIRRLAWHCAASVLAMVSLPGCAEFVAAREARSQNWCEARVASADTDASITRTLPRDCRKVVPPNEAAKAPQAACQHKRMDISRWYRITRSRTACHSRS